MTEIRAQLLPVLESQTGVKFEKLLEHVPALRKAMGRNDSEKTLSMEGAAWCCLQFRDSNMAVLKS
jgi:hypothetical protein